MLTPKPEFFNVDKKTRNYILITDKERMKITEVEVKTPPSKLDMTLCVYQSIDDWLIYVSEAHGASKAFACRKVIETMGIRTGTPVLELPKSPAEIIAEAG